ncbi:MAG: hypothetical protein M0T84_07290 [Betaproteobacteria bacterium]|nr:hypothetical protein [Betaproteobacteria bacterium]
MPSPKKPISLETTFSAYTLDEGIGEGGAGGVFGGGDSDGNAVAVKVLSREKAVSAPINQGGGLEPNAAVFC